MAGRKSWLDVLNVMREAATAEFTLADSQAQYLGLYSALRKTKLTELSLF